MTKKALSTLQKATLAFADMEVDSTQTLELALNHLIETTGADDGAIAVAGALDGEPLVLAGHTISKTSPSLMQALRITLAELAEATILKPSDFPDIPNHSVSSILCIPIRRRGRTLAAVYLDRRGKTPFNEIDLRLGTSFSAMLGLAFDLTKQRERAEEVAEEARALAVHTSGFWRFGAIATHNSRFAATLRLAERVARSEATVLLLGETGVGKEHMARCIHAESSRKGGPLIVVNCAAIPENLLESELFGHERGSFTGAVQTRRGKFELAHGGTLLFDEIGELPLHLQPKLLRALEEKRVMRVGGTEERGVDVRILAATNRDLAAEVKNGRFREDLLYRLNVVTLTLPPLRERTEDIPTLAEAFLAQESKRVNREMHWSDEALRILVLYLWPGNIRELRNVIERLCILSDGPEIDAWTVELNLGEQNALAVDLAESKATNVSLRERVEDAEQAIQDLQSTMAEWKTQEDSAELEAEASAETMQETTDANLKQSFHEQMNAAAREILTKTIQKAGSISAAARVLGLSRQHVSLKCKTLGMKPIPQ